MFKNSHCPHTRKPESVGTAIHHQPCLKACAALQQVLQDSCEMQRSRLEDLGSEGAVNSECPIANVFALALNFCFLEQEGYRRVEGVFSNFVLCPSPSLFFRSFTPLVYLLRTSKDCLFRSELLSARLMADTVLTCGTPVLRTLH